MAGGRDHTHKTKENDSAAARPNKGAQASGDGPHRTDAAPGMRIYRHALEAICALLNLGDLSHALAVSREWSAAVRSMKAIHASVQRDIWRSRRESKEFRPLPPIARIVGSPLLRHVSAIHITHANIVGEDCWTPINNGEMALLAHHAPNLTSLWCNFAHTPDEPLILPAKLMSLELRLDDEYTDAVINGVLTAVAALPSLSCLHLHLTAFADESSVDLSILAACPSLIEIKLGNISGHPPCLTRTQWDQIRSSLGHLQRIDVGFMNSDSLARLLQLPVTARWQDIGRVWADERTGQLLLRLQTLTKLNLSCRRGLTHVEFLPQLPQLTALNLGCDLGGTWFIPPDSLLDSLLLCKSIIELDLDCGFNSAYWNALFVKLTSIKKLTLRRGNLDTLQCFASGASRESLEELTLYDLALPPSELSHLYGLRRLRALHLYRCFSPPLGDATIDSVSPPTPLLPALTTLCYRKEWSASAADYLERLGPSFEWMQARLTQ